MAFELPQLGYAYDALEPHIDAKTMEIHHSKHHNGYTTKLNNAIAGTDLDGKSIEDILNGLDMNNAGVRNNGGGFYNHRLFWEVLNPDDRGRLSGDLLDAVNEAFGSKEAMIEQFSKAAATRFGSGWAWLCVHDGGKLEICSTPNQDCKTKLEKAFTRKNEGLCIFIQQQMFVAILKNSSITCAFYFCYYDSYYDSCARYFDSSFFPLT